MNEINPLEIKKPKVDVIEEEEVKHIPQYNVILLDDDDHTYDYVIEMLVKIFGLSESKALDKAREVDLSGRVIVVTTYKERADHNKRQIESYGPDWRVPYCQGSMSAEVESVD